MAKAATLLLLLVATSAVGLSAGCQVCFEVFRERGGFKQSDCDNAVGELMIGLILYDDLLYGFEAVPLQQNLTCSNYTDAYVTVCGEAYNSDDATKIADRFEGSFSVRNYVFAALNISYINECNPPPYPQGAYFAMTSPCVGRDILPWLPDTTSCLSPPKPKKKKKAPPPKKPKSPPPSPSNNGNPFPPAPPPKAKKLKPPPPKKVNIPPPTHKRPPPTRKHPPPTRKFPPPIRKSLKRD